MAVISKTSVVIKQLKNFGTLDVVRLLSDELKYSEDEIVELNREQMRSSESKEGLLPEYSQPQMKDTANYRGKWPRFDLYDTGNFQNAMFMKIEGNRLTIDSSDSKTNTILDRLSKDMKDAENVFELNDENMSKAREVVTPGLFKRVHNELNKG
jgi:hypothetical protein